jgi:hypothetical protein
VHKFSELERNTLLLTALSTSDNKEGEKLTGGGGEALRGAVFTSTIWRATEEEGLSLFLLPNGRPRCRFMGV